PVEKAKEMLGVSDDAMGYIVADLIRKDRANVKLSAKKHDTKEKEEKQPKRESKPELKPEPQRISKVRVMKMKEPISDDKINIKIDKKESTEPTQTHETQKDSTNEKDKNAS
ncbi:MAG: hypothetical protein QXT63_07330, partial [Thermoplasmata archaeon]